MSDLERMNAKAAREGLEEQEKRIAALENQVLTLTGHVQTLLNMVNKLQQTNTLALQQLRGSGPTSGDNN